MATGVASIITDTQGRPITKPSNFCRLCEHIIRKTDKGLLNCYRSDASLGRMHPQGPIMQRCLSGGLWDAGTSICVGDQHMANWLIGQVLEEPVNEEAMLVYAREIGADEEEFRKALAEVMCIPLKQFEKIADALYLIANQLSKLAIQNVQQARFITERKRAEEALHRLNRELRAISNCNQTLMRAEDEQTLLNDICRIVCDEAGYRMAWVGYAENDDAKTVRPVAWAGVEDGYLANANITWADTERGRGPSRNRHPERREHLHPGFRDRPPSCPLARERLAARLSLQYRPAAQGRKRKHIRHSHDLFHGTQCLHTGRNTAPGRTGRRSGVRHRSCAPASSASGRRRRWKSALEIEDLYDNAPCGYHSLDPDGIFVRVNATELKWLGYTREEVIGKLKFSDVLTPESLTVFEKNFPDFKNRGWWRPGV